MSKSVFQIPLLLVSLTVQASGAAPRLTRIGCKEKCGIITIPFPLGIGAGCFLNDWYEINCQKNNMVILNKIGLRVLNISLPDYLGSLNSMISVLLPSAYSNASYGGDGRVQMNLKGSQFVFSPTRNVLISVGCYTLATVSTTESAVVGRRLICAGNDTNISRSSACSGGMIVAGLPLNLQGFSLDFKVKGEHQGCKRAFLRSDFTGLYDLKLNEAVPVPLERGIANNTDYGRDLVAGSRTKLGTCDSDSGVIKEPICLAGLRKRVMTLNTKKTISRLRWVTQIMQL